MYINNVSVNTRHNHPTVLSKTALVCYFFNDGQYADPYAISAVSIFHASSNFYPSSIIGDDGQILNSVSSLVLANFANSASLTSDSAFDTSNYAAEASGIYRLREGVYAVVLDGNISEFNFNLSGNNTISNGVTRTGDYIDVWTLKRTSGSELDTVLLAFKLHSDKFYNTSEPVLFRVDTRLVNRYITLGSKVDLKFTNEVTIENINIDRSIVDLFKETFILNPAIEICKENEDRNLPSRVTVSSFADTSGYCDITSDNTVLFTFDTSTLATHSETIAGRLGSLTGRYSVRLKFSALGQLFYSNILSFIVR